ncbi:DUF4339 domain-containing protein [Shewanella litorisediminis]|uniref:GYF domain-containing protein n=1 Tax=Shewanella litorisediminis TaxID=1173586 RepID=A0ABX7G1B7_9GAMM|nr:DUF4339 domain-containing protein [Shewanella litorisediminis]MCL2918911.1 hypothetical protein [Shewanella litorisediminis]QRH00983.1 hypothetical protein JQC75_14080 [Shewanella litorisediminis]
MKKWILSHNGAQSAPLTHAEAIAFLQDKPESYGWHPSYTQWLPVSHIPEFSGHIPTPAPVATTVPPTLSAAFERRRQQLTQQVGALEASVTTTQGVLRELEQEITTYKRLTHKLSDEVKRGIAGIEEDAGQYRKQLDDLGYALAMAKVELTEVSDGFDLCLRERKAKADAGQDAVSNTVSAPLVTSGMASLTVAPRIEAAAVSTATLAPASDSVPERKPVPELKHQPEPELKHQPEPEPVIGAEPELSEIDSDPLEVDSELLVDAPKASIEIAPLEFESIALEQAESVLPATPSHEPSAVIRLELIENASMASGEVEAQAEHELLLPEDDEGLSADLALSLAWEQELSNALEPLPVVKETANEASRTEPDEAVESEDADGSTEPQAATSLAFKPETGASGMTVPQAATAATPAKDPALVPKDPVAVKRPKMISVNDFIASLDAAEAAKGTADIGFAEVPAAGDVSVPTGALKGDSRSLDPVAVKANPDDFFASLMPSTLPDPLPSRPQGKDGLFGFSPEDFTPAGTAQKASATEPGAKDSATVSVKLPEDKAPEAESSIKAEKAEPKVKLPSVTSIFKSVFKGDKKDAQQETEVDEEGSADEVSTAEAFSEDALSGEQSGQPKPQKGDVEGRMRRRSRRRG